MSQPFTTERIRGLRRITVGLLKFMVANTLDYDNMECLSYYSSVTKTLRENIVFVSQPILLDILE